MIFPAYLVLATFVFNAASVLGAPVKIASASELGARVVDEPVAVEVVRRFPRRAAYDLYVERSEQPEVREPAPEAPRRFARRALYERVQQRSEPVSEPEVREAAPEVETRRFPRAVYAEEFEKRQATSTETVSAPVAVSSGHPGTPADLNAVIANITSTNNSAGYQEGTTVKETTLLVNKVTHISAPKNAGNCPPVPPVVPVAPGSPSAVPTPTASAVETPAVSPVETPVATPSGTEVPVVAPIVTPTVTETPKAAIETPAAVETPVASPSPSAVTEEKPVVPEVSANPETPTGANETTTGGETAAQRREVNKPIIRRNSGPAWASYSKRTAN